MLNHTKHIRPTSSSSTISKSIPNYLEVLTPQPNDDTYLYNKKPLRELLPARSKSSLSHYKDDSSSSSIHSTNTLNNKTTKKTSTNSSLVYSNTNLSSGGSGSLKKLSKEIRDLKIEELKTRVSNHRLKASLAQQHDNTNNMKTLSKELDYDITISTEASKISPKNKYISYIKNSSSNVNNDNDDNSKTKDPSKSTQSSLTEKNNIEKTEINDLFSNLTPNDYEDPSLFFLEQFLLRIMDKDYKMALPLAHEVLKYDPYNSICKEYITVLQKKIEQDEKEGNNDESEESEDSSSDSNEEDSDDDSDFDEDSSDTSNDNDDESDSEDDEKDDSENDNEEEEEE